MAQAGEAVVSQGEEKTSGDGRANEQEPGTLSEALQALKHESFCQHRVTSRPCVQR